MIIPVMAAAATAGRPVAMLPRRFRQPHAHSRVPVWWYRRLIIFVIAIVRVVRADRRRGHRGCCSRCRVRDRHPVWWQRRRNIIVAVKKFVIKFTLVKVIYGNYYTTGNINLLESLRGKKYYRKFKLNIIRFVIRNFFLGITFFIARKLISSPRNKSSALERAITFNHNYSFRAVFIIGTTAAVDAVVAAVGGITADGLTADFAAKLFRATLSLLE